MMQSTLITCDHCEDEEKFREEDNPFEAGWLSVWEYDTLAEEIRTFDFCCRDCIAAHFT
jgi:hypothetical protein